MNKEQGSSVIALIAVAAVAILVGIWIGAKTDIAEMDMDMDSMPVVQKIMKKKVVNTTDTLVEDAIKVVEDVVE